MKVRQLEKSRDCIDAIDPLELRASSVHELVVGVRKSNIRARGGIHRDLEMRLDHADERLELGSIYGHGSLKLLPFDGSTKLHAMHQVQFL